MKGKAGEEIKLLHLKWGNLKKGIDPKNLAGLLIIDGPQLFTFRTTALRVTIGEEKKILPAPEYMLFLKKLKDGRYEPMSGQIDPALSVRELNSMGE
jgi:hypothetical protein